MPRRGSSYYGVGARSAMVKYIVSVGALLILAAVVQVSVLSRFRLLGAVPDLMLCIVLCIAFFEGRQIGAVTGIAAGGLIEMIGASGMMLLPVFYMIFGHVVGHYARAVIPKRYTAYFVYLGFAVLLRAVITVTYICLLYKDIRLPELMIETLLPELAVTALCGAIAYFPMLLFSRLIGKLG